MCPDKLAIQNTLRALDMSSWKMAEIAVFRGAGQKISELAALIGILQDRDLRTIVEIGTDRGGTFWLWCKLGHPRAKLVSIDMPGGSFGESYTVEEMERFRSWGRSGQVLSFLRMDSHNSETKDALIRILGGSYIDLLFIDGDHSYKGAYEDFIAYSSLVAPGGLIVFHDIVPTFAHQACYSHAVWNEIKHQYLYDEFVENVEDDLGWRLDNGLWGPWGGLGVIHWSD